MLFPNLYCRMSHVAHYPQPGYPGAAAYAPSGQMPQIHHPTRPSVAVAPQQSQQASQPAHGALSIAKTGQVEGAQFRIDHRDSNSMLYVQLQPEYTIKAKPGSMVAMDASVRIRGNLKFSAKKMFTGGEVRRCLCPMRL